MGKDYIVEMKGISKRFGGVQALKNVDLQILPGEAHALMGENGAGKSTLMKILGGVYTYSEGSIKINGEETIIHSPLDSAEKGIAVIYQEQSLVDSLTVADNIMLGRIPNSHGWIDRKTQMRKAGDALNAVAPDLSLNNEIGELTVAQKQFVEIAKAISMNAKLIVMDEPTSVLTLTETRRLFSLITKLKEQGISIIYISHRMEEIFEICDRCTVLKDGVYVGTEEIKKLNKAKLITMMTGREITNIYPEKDNCIFTEEYLKVEGLTKKGVFDDVSFSLRAGEIVGMSGLVGSGRSEVCRSIMGIDRLDSGEIYVHGKKVTVKTPGDAIKLGLAYVSEDRKKDGLILRLPIQNNITISTINNMARGGFIDNKKEENAIDSMMKELSVKASSVQQEVENLSGGNQQKVMLANWILVGADIMIIDEPTRGVDVGTKVEIYKIIKKLAKKGTAILMISSELSEVIGVSDRIIVMRRGKIAGEIKATDANEENVLSMAM